MPGPACSTSMGEEQPAETFDQARVNYRSDKASFMAEIVPGSMVYFRAYVKGDNDEQLRLMFPACPETKNKDLYQWVSRRSSRIWRGPLAKDAWSRVSNVEGAWRPKKRPRAAGRPMKKKDTKLEDGARAASTTGQAEVPQECLEESAECPVRTDADVGTSQSQEETIVWHDLPEDAVVAWQYKHEDALSVAVEPEVIHGPSYAGCEAELKAVKVKHAGKPAHAKSGLERDDSAMEETLASINS